MNRNERHSDNMDRAWNPNAIKHHSEEAAKYEAELTQMMEHAHGSADAMKTTDPTGLISATLELRAKVARLCVLALETKDQREIGSALSLRSDVNLYADTLAAHRPTGATR